MWILQKLDLKWAHPHTSVPYQCHRAVEDIRIQLRFCHGFDSRTEQAIRPELRTPFSCMAKSCNSNCYREVSFIYLNQTLSQKFDTRKLSAKLVSEDDGVSLTVSLSIDSFIQLATKKVMTKWLNIYKSLPY